jgi:hypothetical protein
MRKLILVYIIFYCSISYGQEQKDETKKDTVKTANSESINENPFSMSNKTAWILSSNFTVPTVTFQPTLRDYRDTKPSEPRGTLSFFNAIGAGVNISRANFKLITAKKDTVGTDINNQIGFQAGFLFSRSSTGLETKNRFAVQIGISILDFQVGFGKEFIAVPHNFNSKFITISYGIPLTKFSRKTAHVFKNRNGGVAGKLSEIKKGFAI